MQIVNIFWFRRDLRLNDNAALYHALKAAIPVVPVFIFDKNILNGLEDRSDRRVAFIHAALEEIQNELVKMNASLEIFHGTADEVFTNLLTKYKIEKVFTNHDYEPSAITRDSSIAALLNNSGVTLYTYKDEK